MINMIKCVDIKAMVQGRTINVEDLRSRLGNNILGDLRGINHIGVVIEYIEQDIKLDLLDHNIMINLCKVQSVLEVLV